MKTCTKCGRELPKSEFHCCKARLDGKHAWCKGCVREHGRAYKQANHAALLVKKRIWNEAHREEIRDKRREYYWNRREEQIAKAVEYGKRNPEKKKTASQKYYRAHREELIAKKREYYQTHRKEHQAAAQEYRRINKKERNAHEKARRQSEPEYKLQTYLRGRLYRALKHQRRSGSAVGDLGCTIEHLKSHLEDQFREGMTWDNWGKWHLDHRRPLASFDLVDPEQIKAACHYTNLQPLWAEENLRKGAVVRLEGADE